MRIIIFLAICLVAITFIVISLIKDKEQEVKNKAPSSMCRDFDQFMIEEEDALNDHNEGSRNGLMYCYCK